MADFKIEVPISVKGDKATAGKGKVEKLAETFAKKAERMLSGIGMGKEDGKGAKQGWISSILKTGGGIVAIGAAILGIVPMLKPILNLLRIILILFFLPLIPLLKPLVKGMGACIKWYPTRMKQVAEQMEKLVNAIGTGVTWIWENLLKPM